MSILELFKAKIKFSSIDNLSVGKLRAKGYFEALQKNDVAIDMDLVVLADTEEEFDIKVTDLFKNNKIDGIFAVNEHVSVAGIKMGLKNGYKIPDNLSVIGFADGVWSRRLTPSLSTVSQHGPEIGRAAATLLIEKLKNKSDEYNYKTTVIETELRERESTRKLK